MILKPKVAKHSFHSNALLFYSSLIGFEQFISSSTPSKLLIIEDNPLNSYSLFP